MIKAKELAEELAIWGKYGLDIILDNCGQSIMINTLNEDKWSAEKWINNQKQDSSIVELSEEDRLFLINRKWFWDQEWKKWGKLI